MGYGKRALELLNSFYSGEFFNVNEGDNTSKTLGKHVSAVASDDVRLHTAPPNILLTLNATERRPT